MSAAGGEAGRPGAADALVSERRQAACQAAAAGRYAVRLWSNAHAGVLAAIAEAHGAVPAWLCREGGRRAGDSAVVIAIGLPAWAVGGRPTALAGVGSACLVGQVVRCDAGCARLGAALAGAAGPLAAGLWRADAGAWRLAVPDPLDLPY